MICPDCNGNGEAIYYEYLGTDFTKNTVNIKPKKDICRTCNGSGHTTQTNADRIRAMSDEELAKILEAIAFDVYNCNECQPSLMEKVKCRAMCDNKCNRCILEWLKQPVEVQP